MVKSRSNTFGSWILIFLCVFLFLLLLIGIKLYFIDKDPSKFQMVIFGFVGFIVMLLICTLTIKSILINPDAKTITILNYLTRVSVTYQFSELDGFIDIIVQHGRGKQSFKAIDIKSRHNTIIKIDSYYYSNYDELRSALSGVKYLGINIDWEKQNF